MFTLEDIQNAHGKVKSGSDFPAYIQDIIGLGVISYKVFVSDGHAEYAGSEGYSVVSSPKYDTLEIAQNSNPEQFIIYLKAHQQGGSDYMTFCKQSAETGIESWVVDTKAMTCTYYDLAQNNVLIENIPTV